ncbi:unnamed protein product [Symbiodinium microadriaticum]|nr:unnamed protein product [Symbiodinium microadriaticum]
MAPYVLGLVIFIAIAVTGGLMWSWPENSRPGCGIKRAPTGARPLEGCFAKTAVDSDGRQTAYLFVHECIFLQSVYPKFGLDHKQFFFRKWISKYAEKIFPQSMEKSNWMTLQGDPELRDGIGRFALHPDHRVNERSSLVEPRAQDALYCARDQDVRTFPFVWRRPDEKPGPRTERDGQLEPQLERRKMPRREISRERLGCYRRPTPPAGCDEALREVKKQAERIKELLAKNLGWCRGESGLGAMGSFVSFEGTEFRSGPSELAWKSAKGCFRTLGLKATANQEEVRKAKGRSLLLWVDDLSLEDIIANWLAGEDWRNYFEKYGIGKDAYRVMQFEALTELFEWLGVPAEDSALRFIQDHLVHGDHRIIDEHHRPSASVLAVSSYDLAAQLSKWLPTPDSFNVIMLQSPPRKFLGFNAEVPTRLQDSSEVEAKLAEEEAAEAVSGLGAMAQSANDRALPFPAPPGLDAEAPALSSTHQAVCQAVLQDVEAKVNEKMEEVWQKGRQMLTQVQQKQQEKTDQLVAELRQLQERQEALQTEHESLKQMLVLAASQLALLGAGVGDAKAMRGLSPTTAGTDSVHSITPQRSDLNTAGTEASYSPLPQIPACPFASAAGAPLSLAEALSSSQSASSPAPLSLATSLSVNEVASGYGSVQQVFSITLRKADDTELGLNVRPVEKALLVEGILPDGAVEAFNRQCASSASRVVCVGDRITSVNSVANDPEKMLEESKSKQLLKLTLSRGDGPLPEVQAKMSGLRAAATEFVPKTSSQAGETSSEV